MRYCTKSYEVILILFHSSNKVLHTTGDIMVSTCGSRSEVEARNPGGSAFFCDKDDHLLGQMSKSRVSCCFSCLSTLVVTKNKYVSKK